MQKQRLHPFRRPSHPFKLCIPFFRRRPPQTGLDAGCGAGGLSRCWHPAPGLLSSQEEGAGHQKWAASVTSLRLAASYCDGNGADLTMNND
jgi:hypothetical protein